MKLIILNLLLISYTLKGQTPNLCYRNTPPNYDWILANGRTDCYELTNKDWIHKEIIRIENKISLLRYNHKDEADMMLEVLYGSFKILEKERNYQYENWEELRHGIRILKSFDIQLNKIENNKVKLVNGDFVEV